MRVYMDVNTNEIVTEEVARSRIRKDIDSDEIMSYIWNNIDWSDIRAHLDNGFVTSVVDRIVDEWFNENFDGYDVIESE